MILNAFQTWLNQTTSIYSQATTVSQVDGMGTKAYALKKSVKCAFYEGSAAGQFVSDKFRAKIDGVVIIDPRDVTDITITDSDEIRIGSRVFRTVHNNDVMLRGEILVIGVVENN